MIAPTAYDTEAEAVGPALLREMHLVGGGLFFAGGALVAVVLALGQWQSMTRPVLSATALIAMGAGTGLWLLGRHRPLPAWTFPWLALLGTANISATVWASGADGAGPFGVLYVFVCVYAFYYFPFRVAVVEVVLTGVAYALALAAVGVSGALPQWVVITVANVVIGAMIGRGGHRVRDHLVAQQAAAVRLAELDELRTAFLRAVSHELRTPLTAVQGNAQTLREHGDRLTAAEYDALLSAIERNAVRLGRLLANLLDIDRIQRGVVVAQREPTDVAELVRGVVAATPTEDHPVSVAVVGETTLPIEPGKVERIVENLVGNAVRHTPGGTAVRVVVIGTDEGVDLVVEDDGPGIAPDLARRMFEPFEQGAVAQASAQPGTGIGLTLVARFAELHGGRVAVQHASSGGACFRVHLPRPATPDDDGIATAA